jgi:hypothetical protein
MMAVLDASGRIEVEGYVLMNTGKAILFKREDDDEPVWLPLSQAALIESNRDARAVVLLPRWLARKNGYV